MAPAPANNSVSTGIPRITYPLHGGTMRSSHKFLLSVLITRQFRREKAILRRLEGGFSG